MKKILSIIAIFSIFLFTGCSLEEWLDEETPTNESIKEEVKKEFDPNSYVVKVKITNGPVYNIVSAYGDDKKDFDEMTKAIVDASHFYNFGVNDDELKADIKQYLGTEDGNEQDKWEKGFIITSAPNEYEKEYRIDLYIKK